MIGKNGELSGGKAASLLELIANEIITEVTRIAANDIAALKFAIDRLETTRGIRADYLTQLEAKKAESENMKKIDTGSDVKTLNSKIQAGIKKRRALQDDIHILEDLLAEIDQNVLPETETALNNSVHQVHAALEPEILKIKVIYQQRVNALFSEATAIMVAFSKAVSLVRARPEFNMIKFSSIDTLIEFNVDQAPSRDIAFRLEAREERLRALNHEP